MRDMEILAQMIRESALVEPKPDGSGKPCVRLVESQTDNSELTVLNLPKDTLVIKADKFRSPDDVFFGHNGECKRADYVIISEIYKCIIYIEMKRTSDSLHNFVNQLKGAYCFIKYCREIGKAFWNKENFLDDYKDLFISCSRTRGAKTRTGQLPDCELHDAPHKALRIRGKSTQFRYIAALSR